MTALDKLAQRINEEFNVNIFKHTRSRNVVDARSVFCYIVRTEYSLSLHAIADYFTVKNGKPYDHSTAVHSIKNYEIVKKVRQTSRTSGRKHIKGHRPRCAH
jgi:chromosomal replication initiation ATPase DnaA